MKKLLTAILALICFISRAQQNQSLGSTNTIITAKNQFNIDSAFRGPQDTLASAAINSLAIKNGVHYYKNSQGRWLPLYTDSYTWPYSTVSPLADSTLIPAYRQDAGSVVVLPNGWIFAAWSGFPTTLVGDGNPSNVVGAISKDNGVTWGTPYIIVSGAISNQNHVSTPSLWVQASGNIIMMVNVKNHYATVPGLGTGTNYYRYKSTDQGATFVLQDSVISVVTRYAGITNNRIVKAQKTGRIFIPFLEQTTISAHYQVGCLYSDDDMNTVNMFGWRQAQADSSADEPGAFVLQNKAPNDTAGGAEKIWFYWTNSGQVLYASSVDNGATVQGNYSLGLNSSQTVISLISCENETQVVGVVNRSLQNCCSTQGGQRKFADLVYSENGLNWRTIGNIAGFDSGYHYFEHAITWDSLHSQFMVLTSRMNDPQSRSEMRYYKIPTRSALGTIPLQPIRSLLIGMDQATLASSIPGLLVYNSNIDNFSTNSVTGLSGYFGVTTLSGTSMWPGLRFKTSSGGPLGAYLDAWVGSDVNSQYYSAAWDFVAHLNNGTSNIANVFHTKFINGSTPIFTIDAVGNTVISGYVAPLGFKLKTSTQSGTTQTLNATAGVWVFTGSSATTWTLPALSGNTDLSYKIKNRGSATITLQRAGSDNLYTTSSVTSIIINPGEAYEVINDGSFWIVL